MRKKKKKSDKQKGENVSINCMYFCQGSTATKAQKTSVPRGNEQFLFPDKCMTDDFLFCFLTYQQKFQAENEAWRGLHTLTQIFTAPNGPN